MALSWSFGAKVPAETRSDSRSGELQPGDAFGPFRIEGLLGSGGSSRVYRARHTDGALVALKLARSASLDPARRERFQREGEAVARLGHSGIVRVHSGGEIDGVPFLAYELVDGARDLRTVLDGVGLRERVRLVHDAADAVAHAHQAGIVHRDLKPGNLLVDAAGRVRVADFGLALASGQERLTQHGGVVGTPRYMAPEQTVPGEELGPATDVWALGVVLFEALTGALPFPASRWLELRGQIVGQAPPPLRQINPAVPEDLERLCLRALSKRPAQRPPDGGALARELSAVLSRAALPDDATAAPRLSPPSKPGSGSGPFPLGTVDGFDLRQVLGRGGMGVVYRAYDLELGREVALKFILGDLGPKRLERFRREGQVTASLSHPAILRVHGAGVLRGMPFLKYELVTGARPFDEACAELQLRERLALLRDAAQGLGQAHEAGIVHRDVKPDNLLVGADGRVLVADFGLAAARGMEKLTRTGAMIGTPHYMAPELVGGDRERVGPPTDVWALGVILFQVLTGELPFGGVSLVELSVNITNRATPSPRAHAEVDRGLEAICFKALHKLPEQRYAHAGELAQDLDAWLEGRPLSASTGSAFAPLVQRGGKIGVLLVPLLLSAVVVGVALKGSDQTPSDSGSSSTGGVEGPPPEVPADDPGQRVEPDQVLDPQRLTQPLRILRHGGSHEVRARFLDDATLLSAGADSCVVRWDVASGEELRRYRIPDAPKGELRGLWPMPDGGFFVGSAAVVRRFDAEGRSINSVRSGPCNMLAASPDGRQVAIAGGGARRMLLAVDAESGELVDEYGPYRAPVQSVAYTRDGGRLVSLSGKKNRTGLPTGAELVVWKVGEPEQPLLRQDFQTLGRCIDLAPDGSWFVTGTITGQLLVVSTETGEVLYQFFGEEPEDLGESALLQPRAHAGSVRGLVLSADGRRLFSASQGSKVWANQLRVWDVETRKEVRSAVRRPHNLQWVDLSPGEELLAIGTNRGTVELWAAK